LRKKQIEGKKQGEKMTFTVFGKERIEKLLLINILGTLEALKNKKVTIDESEKVVFTPYTFFTLKKKGINKKIIDLIHEGCELEDVEFLCPEKLDKVIEELKQRTLNLLGEYEEDNKQIWVQIDDVK
jgi:hypothetical protein